MKEIERYYKKIRRYQEKKTALENLKVNFKSLIGINKETVEDVERRYYAQKARLSLSYLIEKLLFEQNPYEAKQELKESKVIQDWFDYYELEINYVTKENVDILFEIMKKI